MPGTDTKLTPESEVPTIPMAINHQGDFLFPRKKASLSVLFLLTKSEISINTEKYTSIIEQIIDLNINLVTPLEMLSIFSQIQEQVKKIK